MYCTLYYAFLYMCIEYIHRIKSGRICLKKHYILCVCGSAAMTVLYITTTWPPSLSLLCKSMQSRAYSELLYKQTFHNSSSFIHQPSVYRGCATRQTQTYFCIEQRQKMTMCVLCTVQFGLLFIRTPVQESVSGIRLPVDSLSHCPH